MQATFYSCAAQAAAAIAQAASQYKHSHEDEHTRGIE